MSTSLSSDVVEGFGDDPQPDKPAATKELAGRSPTRIALGRLAHDKVAVVCGVILMILVLLALLAPVITNALNIYRDYGPGQPDPTDVLEFDGIPAIGPPLHSFTWEHPLGIEPGTGFDNFALLLYGLNTSLRIAVLATIVSTIVGVSFGLVAGYAKGAVDSVMSFVIDFLLSFPFILGALALAPIITTRFGSNSSSLGRAEFLALVGVLVLFGWMGLARLIRGQVFSLREREFVLAARVIGVPTRQILFKELLPNLVAPIVVAVSLSLPAFVAAEAGLSFLGIGLSEGTSLGKTINSASGYYDKYPLYLWVPVATIMVLVIALNLLGDSVRDAFDPKTRR